MQRSISALWLLAPMALFAWWLVSWRATRIYSCTVYRGTGQPGEKAWTIYYRRVTR